MIAIVGACGNNLSSVRFALARMGCEAIITTAASDITSASHVILPGVGHAEQAMVNLSTLGLVDCIRCLTQPVLGICLGMQIMYAESTEGSVKCLDIFPGIVERIPDSLAVTIPHMGWNYFKTLSSTAKLFNNVPKESYVYYVHSYVAAINAYTLAKTDHGIEFSAVVQKDNFFGMQFHPERSGKVGHKLLENFLAL